jgi:hypothetical protein
MHEELQTWLDVRVREDFAENVWSVGLSMCD